MPISESLIERGGPVGIAATVPDRATVAGEQLTKSRSIEDRLDEQTLLLRMILGALCLGLNVDPSQLKDFTADL